jgi:hypothetical protein
LPISPSSVSRPGYPESAFSSCRKFPALGRITARVAGSDQLLQLRHSRLTHLGGQNVSAPLLMAISGRKRLATLQRYVQPSQAAVAALMAASDPDRRSR